MPEGRGEQGRGLRCLRTGKIRERETLVLVSPKGEEQLALSLSSFALRVVSLLSVRWTKRSAKIREPRAEQEDILAPLFFRLCSESTMPDEFIAM